MPNSLFCWHKWGKWSKLRNGVKTRKCLKRCGASRKRKAGFFDQLFCWHRYGGRRGKRSIQVCIKCAKPRKVK